MPDETGVTFRNDLDIEHPLRRLYHSGFVCGGVAVGDVNGDDRADIFFVSGPHDNRLYIQSSQVDFKFDDVTQGAFADQPERWGTGATMVDIDNDGDLDLYVCNYDAPNQLWLNDGTGRFKEAAADFGLGIIDASLMATFADHDRDGHLDMYLLTNRYYRDGGRPRKPPVAFDAQGRPYVTPENQKYYTLIDRGHNRFGIDDYLFFRNNGKGQFENVTQQAGIRGHGFGLSATWLDFNNDLWPDLYVCNDFDDPDRLYRNNGDGTFTDVLVDMVPHTSWFSMGSDAGDINNDALFDLFMVDMSPTTHFKQKTTMGVMSAQKLAMVSGPPPQVMRNSLLINSGVGRFWEAAYLAGIADTDWSWATRFVDLDNDGWLDVFVGNGMVRNFNDSDIVVTDDMLIGRTKWDIYQHAEKRPEQNLAFRNRGDLHFDDVSKAWQLDQVGMSYGTATADFDHDGDLDLVIVNMDEPISLVENLSEEGHRVVVRLAGTASNRAGQGAIVTIRTNENSQIRYTQPVAGFLGCSEPLLHFGLGTASTVKELNIEWPSGIKQSFRDLKVDHEYMVCEPAEASGSEMMAHRGAPSGNGTPNDDAMFLQQPWTVKWSHQEREYDDFAKQPLLPNKLSQLGPGMAAGDVDGDGDQDLYIGGAAGQVGVLLRNEAGTGLKEIASAAFAEDRESEDMGCVFLDVDRDGDLDLYIVSGGVECEPQDERLRDRLYMNDGHGGFQKAIDRLPDVRASGGPVCAADWDRDGDLDLFVGGRVVSGDYPLAPQSQLLRNDDGHLVDVTSEAGAEIAQAGMATSAVWTDLDQDGWVDLLVSYEWGPVRIWWQRDGKFVDGTTAAGLAEATGWWNGLDVADLDGDGDLDFVATNFGLNTKYHASLEHPALLYYGDFDRSGTKQLVEAEFEDETLFPIRGRSCSSRAMPFLADKFQTFRDFALADLNQLYTPECLQDAQRFAATRLESSCFWNDGNGRFTITALPALAQVAPGFGVHIADWNADGRPDIFCAQNFFTPQAETGRMDGGMGLLLINHGDQRFEPLAPSISGVVAPGDAKSVIAADINQDSLPDLIVANNNSPPQIFLKQAPQSGRLITLQLRGPAGNVSAIGARVLVELHDGTQQLHEVHAGGGYLSQHAAPITVGLPNQQEISGVTVTWPTTQVTTRHELADGQQTHEIIMP
jgi:hypothetical protein